MRADGGLRRMPTLAESPGALARTPEEQLLPVARVALALLTCGRPERRAPRAAAPVPGAGVEPAVPEGAPILSRLTLPVCPPGPAAAMLAASGAANVGSG